MLSKDGEFVFYRLQRWTEHNVSGRPDPHWHWPSFDHFGYPSAMESSAACWQAIGEHGTFDYDKAVASLVWISSKHPADFWRIVKVTMSQTTEPGIVMGQQPQGIEK